MKLNNTLLSYAAWTVALVATLGSLFLSEVMHLPPCPLCWYQRICVYPLVIIIGVGILRREQNWPYYAIPLTAIGGIIALYHTLLQWHIISEKLLPCVSGYSCATAQINLFGFITIPFLSLLTFAILTGLAIMAIRKTKYV